MTVYSTSIAAGTDDGWRFHEKSGTIFALLTVHNPLSQAYGMSTKRILIVHDDRLLSNLYREKLEGSGFAVDTVRALDEVPKILESRRPDLVLLDLVLREGGAVQFVRAWRQDSTTAEIPILALPTNLSSLVNASMQAGVNKVIASGTHPLGSILDTAKVTLGMPGLGGALDAPLFQPDESWLTMVLASAPESLNLMRHSLPGLISTPPDLAALRSLWTLVHNFADRAALLHSKALSRIASSLDLLLCDVNEMPEQLTPAMLRTIGHAIDFMGVISDPTNLSRSEEPANARVLAVDDEESATQFITSAMQLAGVRSEVAGSAQKALEMLEGKECDLIFLDIGLPGMNGFELCARIRALDAHKRTPIVFITGMPTFQHRAQASLSGGNDFVGKPCNPAELAVKALTWIVKHQLNMT
jgi:DNA-binding response OmpR family regulator